MALVAWHARGRDLLEGIARPLQVFFLRRFFQSLGSRCIGLGELFVRLLVAARRVVLRQRRAEMSRRPWPLSEPSSQSGESPFNAALTVLSGEFLPLCSLSITFLIDGVSSSLVAPAGPETKPGHDQNRPARPPRRTEVSSSAPHCSNRRMERENKKIIVRSRATGSQWPDVGQ